MKRKLLSLTTVIMMALSCLVFTPSYEQVSAEDSVLFESNFDDGTINDWTPFGGAGKLSLDETASHSGQYSLKITERTESYHGPSITGDAMFRPEKTYSFTAWAYQNTESVKNITWTIRYVDSLGTSRFEQIGTADVQPDTWTEISGTLTMPDDSIAYLLYFECSHATADFNIDDISITGERVDQEEAGTDQKGYLYSFDFENGNELWSPRGDNRLVRTDEYAHTGSHSIYVMNRNKTWNGPTVNVNDIKRGVSYFYSAYIMYTGDEYDDKHGFRMELQYNLNGETVYNLITAKDIKKDQWTRITGTYTLPDNASDVSFYLQTRNLEEGENLTDTDLASFYTDTVTICETSVIRLQTAVKAFIIFAAALIALIIIRLICLVFINKVSRKKEVLNSRAKDAMTQCYNRNSYEQRLKELEADPELCKNLHFTLCDVNFLKYINDNLGHEKGDEAITRCGQMLMNTIGDKGDVYRIGGDEFVCITSVPVLDSVRSQIEKESQTDKGYPFAVASGAASYDITADSDKPDVKKIIERSDKEMYSNKQEIKSKNAEFSRK